MKKLTNKQRCRNCIHKTVCKWYGHYDELDYLGDRCKYYFSKERAFQKKRKKEAEERSENGKS